MLQKVDAYLRKGYVVTMTECAGSGSRALATLCTMPIRWA